MTADPRAALTSLVAALERHLEVATSRRDPDDPAVVSAAEELTDAFFDYDEALFETTGVTTPLDGPYDEDDEDDDDEEERGGGRGRGRGENRGRGHGVDDGG